MTHHDIIKLYAKREAIVVREVPDAGQRAKLLAMLDADKKKELRSL